MTDCSLIRDPEMRGRAPLIFGVTLGTMALLLLLACVNVTTLLLSRSAARQREIAVRLSIGAGRFRLIRQLLTESLVLSLFSGALGVIIAIAGTRLLTVLLANSGDGLSIEAGLNWRVLGITIALSVLCGVLFGLAPAVQSTRPALVPALKEMSRLPRHRLAHALVVGQIALLMLLLMRMHAKALRLAHVHAHAAHIRIGRRVGSQFVFAEIVVELLATAGCVK